MTLQESTAVAPLYFRLAGDIDNMPLDHLVEFDVKARVGRGPDAVTFLARSDVLCARSEYFYDALSSTWTKEDDLFFVLDKPHVKPSTFEEILSFIYNGKTNLDKFKAIELYELLKAADELLLENLVEAAKLVLFQRYRKCEAESFVVILNHAFGDWSTTDFQHKACELISEAPWALYNSPHLACLRESTMQSLAESTNEIGRPTSFLDIVIKWGVLQNPKLPQRVSAWTQKEYSALKTTVRNVVAMLQFSEPPCAYAHEHLIPFDKIAPVRMRKQLVKAGFLPMKPFRPRLILPLKNLVTEEIADRVVEELNLGNHRPKNVLRSRSSLLKLRQVFRQRSGSHSVQLKPQPRTVSFRLVTRCLNKNGRVYYRCFDKDGFIHNAALVIAKRTDSDQVVGAYTPDGLARSYTVVDSRTTPGAFIFSFPSWNFDRSTGRHYDTLPPQQWQDRGVCKGELRINLEENCCEVIPDISLENFYVRSQVGAAFAVEECEVYEVQKEEIILCLSC